MTEQQRIFKKLFKQKPKPEIASLSVAPRCRYMYENDPDMVEYGFLPFEDMTEWEDEEVEEYIREEIRLYARATPYDCTGDLFTWMCNWHRNPNGRISYQNYIGMDI